MLFCLDFTAIAGLRRIERLQDLSEPDRSVAPTNPALAPTMALVSV